MLFVILGGNYSQLIRSVIQIVDMTTEKKCQHPNHEGYFEAFLEKHHTATREGGYGTIITVNPRTWYISHNPKENTVECRQICSLSEELKRASNPSRRIEY